MSSTPEVSSLPRREDNQPLEIFSGSASINDSNPTPSATQTVGVGNEDDDTDIHFQKKKRAKKSAVWLEFTEETINGQLKARCNHCKSVLKVHKSGSTTHFNRHLEACIHRKKNQIQLQQQKLNFPPTNASADGECITIGSGYTDGKLDMMKMSQGVANYVLIDEATFSSVEGVGFNMLLKMGMPEWEKVSRTTAKKDCEHVYEVEKKKLKARLKGVTRISLTTDLWKSTAQKREYMVITGHFVDANWKLHTRVMNFVHIPPPHGGVQIADCLYQCAKEWGIENKVYSISVDNASTNDKAIRLLKDTFSRSSKLFCNGQLFHIRCCAHILNLMVQDGLSEVGHIIDKIHDSVTFINNSDARILTFAKIAQQCNLKERRLVFYCKTRWNSTYEMCFIACKFKEVFKDFKERDSNYICCPSEEDWRKIDKVCEVLKVFNEVTKIFSGSNYPTSNLFLNEVREVKILLDRMSEDENDFIRDMTRKMKEKFDKYWGECNMLMAIASILDPRGKMMVIEFSFSQMYAQEDAHNNIFKVRETLFQLYNEYEAEYYNEFQVIETSTVNFTSSVSASQSSSGWDQYAKYIRSKAARPTQKSDLERYLEDDCYTHEGDPLNFDVLNWWKLESNKYHVLSRMARDILSIPITTVTSEATFSAGSRIIDPYRASLAPQTVQVLLCAGNWARNQYGVKKKPKEMKLQELILPLVD